MIMHSSGLDLKRKKHQLSYLLLSVYAFWGIPRISQLLVFE